MDLFKNLKKLQKIEPDADYAAKSKQIILSTEQKLLPAPAIWQVIRQTLESGLSVVVVSILLILLLGGFSIFKFLTPFQAQNFDQFNLIAEAQNIDIQIQLADLQYAQTFRKFPANELSKATEESKLKFAEEPGTNKTITTEIASGTPNPTPEPKETKLIEEAIEKLLE